MDKINIMSMISNDDMLNGWVAEAFELLPVINCLVHVTSGAPPRGTEIGSVPLKNTAENRRGVFFYQIA